jgi:type II secretory pathway predicted ATPase ExeA
MGKAGAADLEIFPADVVAEIHRSTGGVPRLINALCARLLATCRDLQIDAASTGMVTQLADDLMLTGFDDSRSSRLHKAAHW